MSIPQIFDREARRLRRGRGPARGRADFLAQLAGEELLDRIDAVQRHFTRALELGCGSGIGEALRERDVAVTSTDVAPGRAGSGRVAEEDALPFEAGSFDLVVSASGLDTVNDLPGALVLARRALAPDGLFIAALSAAGTLPTLRRAMRAADEEDAGASPRFHPQVDVRAAGDLLGRAGFALPVADTVRLDLRYPDLFALVADLRDAGATNLLADRARTGLTRAQAAAAAAAFADAADPDGRTRERIELVVLTGWAPAPSQPQPARRGSGTQSLAEALKPKA